jgi:hypothetical protein
MIRRLVALLPIPAAGAFVYGAFEFHHTAGWFALVAACLFLEWRYDRD